MNKRKIKYIGMGVFGAICIIIIFIFFFYTSSIDKRSFDQREISQYADRMLSMVKLLDRIHLDTDIFKSVFFVRLIDGTVDVPLTSPKGRINPFLSYE